MIITILNNIFKIIICHMIGDYVLQCDFIAKTKGSNWYHLFVHCILYVVPFAVVFGLDWRVYVLLLTHLIIDPSKARYNKITYLQDQVLHYIVALILFLI